MTGLTNQKWSELLKSGGATTFFESFPDDEELAKQLNATFKSSSSITTEQIRRDRERFYFRPIIGEVVEEKAATPTKFVIRNKAQQLNIEQALAEILDNIFDNYQRNKPKSLSIEIIAYPESEAGPGEIIITENSGGIDKAHIVPLIQLGFSERSLGGIGAWGEGFKMAVFALGEEIEVFSSYPGEQPTAIKFPRGWLDPNSHLWKEWKVETFKISKNPPPVGTTILRINYLDSKVMERLGLKGGSISPEEVCIYLTDYFGEVYAEKYHNLVLQDNAQISVRLIIGSVSKQVAFKERVKTRLTKSLAFIPWLKPIHWTLSWEVKVDDPNEPNKERTAKLNAEVYAGIAENFNYSQLYSRQDPGVEMWGNGRLFSLKGRISDESAGWGYKFGGSAGTNPESNASSRRLTIIALFTSDDSRDIPWAAPVKNDYNRRSEFYAEIRETFARVIRLYKDVFRFLDSRLLPYSLDWVEMTAEQKLKKLFENSDATDESKSNFADSRFGRKLLNYKPDTTFMEIQGDSDEITVYRVFGMNPPTVQNIVNAASQTKNSGNQVVEYLKALFPSLQEQAKLEEDMGLSDNEEVEL